MENILIIGLGAMGASLARVLKKKPSFRVGGWDIDPGRTALCLQSGWISYERNFQSDLSEIDLIFLATPVSAILKLLQDLSGRVNPGSLVTDIGSTKNRIIKQAARCKISNFIGGHPMCGFEHSGPENSDPKVFKDSIWVLCPPTSVPRQSLKKLKTFISAIGAKVIEANPLDHDKAVSVVSHLSQIISTALSSYSLLRDKKDSLVFDLASSGFRDMTRISASPFNIWRDIFETNGGSIINSINGFQRELSAIKNAIKEKDFLALETLFSHGNEGRSNFLIRRETKKGKAPHG